MSRVFMYNARYFIQILNFDPANIQFTLFINLNLINEIK